MKKNSFIRLLSASAVGLLLAGCAVKEMPSDITLDELEVRMSQAMDPAGDYRKALSYFQRQNIEEDGFFGKKHQLVEVRFQRPDKFKFSFFAKNRIVTELLSVGGKAWMIDYQEGTVTELTGEALEKFKIMLALGHPDTDYDRLFASVQLSLVEEDDHVFYKLVCQPKLTGANPIVIYVDQTSSLPRRIALKINTPQGTVESTSEIEQYQAFNTINVPAVTRVSEGSRDYLTRVVGYQLNAPFNAEEFQLPVFDRVLLEVQKYKESNN